MLKKYWTNVNAWAQPFLKKTTKSHTTKRCAIHITPQKLFFVKIDKTTNTGFQLLTAQTLNYEETVQLPLILSGLANKERLSDIPLSWILGLDDYQLFVLDALPVPEGELRSALNWRLRSLVSYPIEEAIVDYFLLPGKKSDPSKHMIAAITARSFQLRTMIDYFNKSGFLLDSIDIPELSLKNLTMLYETDEKSTAFIYFYENTFILNITREKTLYFTRRINKPTLPDSEEINFEQLSLDIMRYFDYFQSQWRFPAPSRILVASFNGLTETMKTAISQYLLLPVESYDIKKFLSLQKTSESIENFLLPLGTIMREEKIHARATS